MTSSLSHFEIKFYPGDCQKNSALQHRRSEGFVRIETFVILCLSWYCQLLSSALYNRHPARIRRAGGCSIWYIDNLSHDRGCSSPPICLADVVSDEYSVGCSFFHQVEEEVPLPADEYDIAFFYFFDRGGWDRNELATFNAPTHRPAMWPDLHMFAPFQSGQYFLKIHERCYLRVMPPPPSFSRIL